MDPKKSSHEAGFGSDALKNPQRIVFITRKTSAKVKGEVPRQVMSYPHLLLREAIALQVLVIGLVLVSLAWDAPLEQLANPLLTPNPAKAPWYFLGLQELLHYFPPLVAGIIIPTLVVIALVVIPYFPVNVKGEPIWAKDRQGRLVAFIVSLAALIAFIGVFAVKEATTTSLVDLLEATSWPLLVPSLLVAALMLYAYYVPARRRRWSDYLSNRPLSWWIMTWFIVVSITLTVMGTFFRGPGWSFVLPWRTHAR
jgi:menaquinol-cytochrome c reductase cytochrome b/c subunit